MLVQLLPPLFEYSHRITFPVFPARVMVPLPDPEQAEVIAGETVPPIDAGLILIVPDNEALTQGPVVVTK